MPHHTKDDSNHNNHNNNNDHHSDNDSASHDHSSSQLTGTSRSSQSLQEMTSRDHLIRLVKFSVAVTLLASALGVSLLVLFNAKHQEENHFRGDFNVLADELARLATYKVQDLYREMDEVAVGTTSLTTAPSFVQHRPDASSWPHVTLQYFEPLAYAFRDISHAKILILSPTVSDVADWEDYAAAHQDEWLGNNGNTGGTGTPMHTVDGKVIPRDTVGGTYNPVWEIWPVPAETSLYNLDLRSVPEFDHAVTVLAALTTATTTVVSETITNLAERLQVNSLPDVTNDHPHSLAVHPILESLSTASKQQQKIVGYFVSILTWESFLGDILHDQDTLTAVVDNTCGEAFTYEVIGPNVHYLGPGDLHNTAYDDYEVAVPFVNAQHSEQDYAATHRRRRHLQEEEDKDDEIDYSRACVFTLHIYPTPVFHHSFLTRTPIWLCMSTFAVFVATAMAFVLWDQNNAAHQRKVQYRVRKTTKIISAMFPKHIREELMKKAKEHEQMEKLHQQQNNDAAGPPQSLEYPNNIHSGGGGSLSGFGELANDDFGNEFQPMTQSSKPLADLYVATTIMFADICGFTAWSSVREPTHVFQLLEAIFSSFDEMARKMGVFKVETVGDCYVAVAGMPEARDDHAVLMARFAQKCQRKVDEIMEILVLNLGPDTAELGLRCGLHSGPVTAGVLRGDRARLQLFGDTMNTTSRIETSGLPKRIHVSPETAHLLEQHQKGHWLERREDLVVAKGKGAIQTYWLKVNNNTRAQEGETSHRETDAGATKASKEKQEDAQTRKMNHLVDWNCEILIKLVKQIVHKRQQQQQAGAPTQTVPSSLRAAERSLCKATSDVISEIAEIIPMSDRQIIDDDASTDGANQIELDPRVERQIRNLVTIISKMYRDNPFHCFEHASHVTMAVTKLLSRIHKSVGERDQTYGITADPLTQFAIVVAALIHDVDHRGIPNGALKTEDPLLSAAYKHQSVAEQNSVDLAWNVMMDPSFAALRSCLLENEEDLRRLRQLIVNSVMATDIFDKDLGALRRKRWADAFHNNTRDHEPAQTQLHRKATIVIEHLIQASDVSHTMQHWHVYQKWNERLFAENYRSFLEGRTAKDPSPGWYRGELWFFDNYVIPLTRKLKECGVFGVSSDEYLNYATNNRCEWEKKGEGIVEKFLKKYAATKDE